MASERSPNILWITTDQQRYDTIGAFGNKDINTPSLDRLAEEGIIFSNTYSQSTVCQPSRASFLTGLYPNTVHINRNGNRSFPKNVELVTCKLADCGYRCGLAGKLHIASAWKGEERTDDGYHDFHDSISPFQNIEEGNDYVDWLVNEKKVDLNEIFVNEPICNFGHKESNYSHYKEDLPPELHQTTWCVEKAIEFIEGRQKSEKPWLFSVNFFDPHPPFDAPKKYKDQYNPEELPQPSFEESDLILQQKLQDAYHQTTKPQRPDQKSQEKIASYYGMVSLIDEQVGRLVDFLEKTDQREDTIIIFHSDHGTMLGDHGLWAKGCRFYEGAVRVPLIISWPGKFVEGYQNDGLVELTDIVPTLAEICGIEPLNPTDSIEEAQGKSLLPVLSGEEKKTNRDFVRCEYYDSLNMYAPYNPEKHDPTYATMYYDGRYKLVVYHGLKTGELYDHESDPEEFVNLWDEPQMSKLKMELLKKSFDKSMMATDPGPPLHGRY